MKFERLNVPDWQLPDLVAFNERVHEWVDPWWARRWVRCIAWAGAALFALFAAMWIYFASRPALVADPARLSAAAPDQRSRL